MEMGTHEGERKLVYYDTSRGDTSLNFSLVRILHRSKAFVGSMIVPINQHETFQRGLSSLTRFLGNFPECHPSHNYSKLSTLNYGVLIVEGMWRWNFNFHKEWFLWEKEIHDRFCLVLRGVSLHVEELQDQYGSYSVKSSYVVLSDRLFGSTMDDILAHTWSLKIPQR
ncbi:hypothetical protein GmHk_18G051836 [Glycine max]|nr:hypothetical protein GmHk_18G051836 [Glycine max]